MSIPDNISSNIADTIVEKIVLIKNSDFCEDIKSIESSNGK